MGDDIAGYTKEELLQRWDAEPDMNVRDTLIRELTRRKLFPSQEMNAWETEAGLYPDTTDPYFTEKIMQKQEFIENVQDTLSSLQKQKVNPCNSSEEFELSPPQRFITRFLSPHSPYVSALLYHGVGVGKTCAAISTAEEYLRVYPRESVFIIAPRNIQPGFRRTIFDDEALTISEQDDLPNTLKGCTGNSYLVRTGMEYEREKSVIQRKVKQAIDVRYTILGYVQFYRYIKAILERVPPTLDDKRREQEEIKLLRREFSGRMVIIDEAHNLRDTPGETEDDNVDAAGGDAELSESKAGKRLTPLLLRVVQAAEGMKLLLLTGTPMYNNYHEIIFLLNLLLLNDKKAPLTERDIFLPNGKFCPGGEERLGATAAAYLSFMRGENPLTFPVRLFPQDAPTIKVWPSESPQGEPLFPEGNKDAQRQRDILLRLPFVPVSYGDKELKIIRDIADTAVETSGLGVKSIDEMVQSGNWLFPEGASAADPIGRIRDAGFTECFEEVRGSTLVQFKSRISPPNWLKRDEIHTASPKTAFILKRIQKTIGLVFVYSRFVKSGALPFAIALEANGYTAYGRTKPLFVDGVVDGLGRQCALCEGRERAHPNKSHAFAPAYYALLTGQAAYSPNNPVAIQAARAVANMDGKNIKVVVGSQVASEGIDLRFIREIYVFDSWFHLNKMEQVLGRGVRTCSHSLLPEVKRNCTIHLLVNSYGAEEAVETADMYMYRNAMVKALQIGSVTRVLKRYALDCNLNHNANFVKDLDAVDRMEDSRGDIRENVEINDTPYTSVCDWIECPYTCEKKVDVEHIMKELSMNMSTYDEYSMRWRETQIKNIIKHIFENEHQPMIQIDSLIETLRAADIPEMAIRTILADIVGKPSFRIRIGNREGYIIYRNTYYLFQPIYLADVRIPLALRVASVPVRKDEYDPRKIVYDKVKGAKAVAPAPDKAAVPDEAIAPEEAPAVAPEEVAPQPEEAPAPKPGTGKALWDQCKLWAATIGTMTSVLDIPPEILETLELRYTGDEYKRMYNYLIMISWMVENIQTSYTEDVRQIYAKALADLFLEMIWDEVLTAEEQIELVAIDGPNKDLAFVFEEQLLKKGASEVYRYINLTTGGIEYRCGADKCSDAVVRLFDQDKTNPFNTIQANNTTAGKIYGFIIPKIKDARLVFKTNDRPVDPGIVPEKGGECEIVSSIEIHKKLLRAMREMMEGLGYPPFLLTDAVLDEKEERKKGTEEKKRRTKKKGEEEDLTPAQKEFIKVKTKLKLDSRKFQNVVKACALKNIILRLIDKLERAAGRLRYFYRPIAALKSKHKLK
jgi:hypothetical protein